MRIGLAVYEFRNKDVDFNVSQIEKAMKAAQGKVDLLCFGESFLQGFDALDWNYELDRHVAVSTDSKVMRRLCGMTQIYKVDLLLGYLEGCDSAIYSSCVVIENGEVIHNYRRISKGWKEFRIADGHYKEGADVSAFSYRGRTVTLALCGDLWDFPEKFRTDGILIWPVYVNFSLEEWAENEAEYARQASLASDKTLMINSISKSPDSHGGSFYFVGGRVRERSSYDEETVLTVEV